MDRPLYMAPSGRFIEEGTANSDEGKLSLTQKRTACLHIAHSGGWDTL